jgi:DNA mismatch repair protein MutL
MSRIAVLPDSLARKIAAGEVIERPVSVVKELLENALDAGAGSISIDLEAGGKALIRIRDDGCGMGRADAALALVRHATSKISREEDLSAISTLGFRGEALASIAAVSRLVLLTFDGGDGPGTRIESEPGSKERIREAAFPRGTEIEVRDLFFNLPARKKFLRGDSSELNLVVKLLSTVALAHPGIRLTVRHGVRTVLDCPPVAGLGERLYQIQGKEALDRLMEVSFAEGPVRVSGFASRPPYGRPDRTRQVFFVNKRPVKDKILAGAVNRAFAGLLEKGLFPEACLFFDIPPADVDVNVHPAKTEVRFRDQQMFFPLIGRAVERARTRVLGVMDLAEVLSGKTAGDGRAESETGRSSEFHAGPVFDFNRKTRYPASGEPVGASIPSAVAEPGAGPRVIGQYASSYILAEEGGDLLVIDQHNAHERVLYDRYVEIDREKKWPVKMSLLPLVFELSPAQALNLETGAEALLSAGFRVEPMGGKSYALREFPDVFKPEEALAVVLDALEEPKPGDSRPVKTKLLATMACKSAVKAGEFLPREKMEFLAAELFRSSNPGVCPHGRPIIVRVSKAQIERGIRRPVSDPKFPS